jgi:hypothetical protein
MRKLSSGATAPWRGHWRRAGEDGRRKKTADTCEICMADMKDFTLYTKKGIKNE